MSAEKEPAMNVQSLKANWKIGMGKLRQCFAKWIADEAEYQQGKQTELIGRILKGSPEREAGAATKQSLSPWESCNQ
jgi:hypothetical protein